MSRDSDKERYTMKTRRKSWKSGIVLALMLVFSMCMPVLAASDDNSLSSLNLHNGTLSRDFQYDIWEYDVTVDPGTTELLLEPTTSDPNASVTSITGTVLENGEATVLINTVSESGVPMTYTLHVTESGDGEAAAAETEAVETEPQTTQPDTEAPTEAAATEAQSEPETEEAVATNALQDQVAKLKSDSDLMMKIVYGLIALCVILLFFIINLILKNRDLKDDLKDAENQLAYQTNEFARKERMMATDTYYAPTQQGQPAAEGAKTVEQMPAYTPVQQSAPAVEETFGTRASEGGYQGMQPEDVPPNRPITAEPEPVPEPVQPEPQPNPAAVQAEPPSAQAEPAAVQADAAQPGAEPANADVDVTMVEL